MAISRMQQPRQMYGLGSFVKKLTRKVTRPFTKVASKIVPKEIAGIMRIAAPFLGPVAGPAAYLLGTAKQTGRISPMDLALTLAPTVGKMTLPDEGRFSKFIPEGLRGDTVRQAIGKTPLPITDKNLGEVLVGRKIYGPKYSAGETYIGDNGIEYLKPGRKLIREESGIFGKGGDMFKFGQDKVGLLDTKVGQTLFGKPEMKDGDPTGSFVPSYLKIGSTGVSLASLIKDAKTPEEAGNALVEATGNSDDYEAGVQMFSALPQGIFDIPQQFRLNSANGGLMRTNYASGTKFNDKYLAPEYEEDFKKFLQELREQNKEMDLDNIMEMFKQKMRRQDPILEAKNGGLMRTNYAIGSDDEGEPIRPDPTKPINPFGPKPTGPVLPDKKASLDNPFYRSGDEDEHSMRMFGKPYKELNADELEEFREEMMRLMNKFSGGENNRVRELLLKEETEGLTEDEKEELRELIKTISAQAPMSSDQEGIMMAKKGGRANLALGTNPTPEESGLGGLPIEADMRYTGGFMPYGEKEKADDVPARLSKNEFVFTADAVRAAGGGSVNEGAKKMYQAMKQLEKKPEAKGMMA